LDRVTIEVPSGLIDEGESVAQSAVRELREETGYVGTIAPGEREDGGVVMWNDPGFCVS
jgi:ADP-ribose pyrophosphatase